jgi:hypothetical protein
MTRQIGKEKTKNSRQPSTGLFTSIQHPVTSNQVLVTSITRKTESRPGKPGRL